MICTILNYLVAGWIALMLVGSLAALFFLVLNHKKYKRKANGR